MLTLLCHFVSFFYLSSDEFTYSAFIKLKDLLIFHVMNRLRVKWRRSMIPDLVDELRKLEDSQYREVDRALCGRGTHMLRPDYQRHRVTVEQWMAMTEVQRQRVRDSCFVLLQLSATGTSQSVSTDGELRVNCRPNAGKKMNQRKRGRAKRTTTPNKLCKNQ